VWCSLRKVECTDPYLYQPEEISPATKKKSKAKHDTEDWCIYCRDGGDVILCTSCPRGETD
jgi:hypothetical protein